MIPEKATHLCPVWEAGLDPWINDNVWRSLPMQDDGAWYIKVGQFHGLTMQYGRMAVTFCPWCGVKL